MSAAKIVFAISDAGYGHRRVSESVQYALESMDVLDLKTEIVDFLKDTQRPPFNYTPDVFNALSNRQFTFFNWFYRLTNHARLVDWLAAAMYILSRRRVTRYLAELDADLIVVANPSLIGHVINRARRRHPELDFRVLTLITDLVWLHTAWCDHNNIDRYLVPTQDAHDWLLRKGVAPERIRLTGYPVHPKFSDLKQTRPECREQLGLDPQRFTILLTAGRNAAGRLFTWVGDLEQRFPEYQFLVICGHNRRLRAALRTASSNPHLHVHGPVDNMELFMGASDLVMSKAGPLTIMESAELLRPIIVTEAVGLQETGNIALVKEYQLGEYCPTLAEAVAAIERLSDPARYAAAVAALQAGKEQLACCSTEIARLLVEELYLN